MNFFHKQLKDDLFCVTEERDYFQAKYLEQVSEISALKSSLDMQKSEIRRLRQELMNSSSCTDDWTEEEKKLEHEDKEEDIRQNAAKLLQWADYRGRDSITPSCSPVKSAIEYAEDEEQESDDDDEATAEEVFRDHKDTSSEDQELEQDDEATAEEVFRDHKDTSSEDHELEHDDEAAAEVFRDHKDTLSEDHELEHLRNRNILNQRTLESKLSALLKSSSSPPG
jgi:hypothetical protein